MRILQNDRKANIEVLEANKVANKEDVRRLRDDNKEFRQKIAQLQRAADADADKDEQRSIEREVEYLRREYDDLKSKSTISRTNLEKLRDAVRDLELDSQRPHMEDNDYTRRIRALENKLDKAMIKYNEAQSIRKTYEQIVRRLNEERVGFDNQLAAIERTLQAKGRDHEELLLLAGDANHAREIALNELDRVRSGYEEERARREKELRERHQVVQLRRQMLERIKQREKMRSQLLEENEKNNNSVSNALNASLIANERIETRNKIDIFENAFRKIKEATGVSDVNEVIQKIMSQENTTENLIQLTRENQIKIENLNDDKRRLKNKVEEMKYSGVSGGARRKLVDDHEDQLSSSVTRLERGRLKYDRLSKLIISMKAGVGHLQDKLETVREELGGQKFDLGDETVVEVLRECELCITNIIRRIKAGDEARKREKMTSAAMDSSTGDLNALEQMSLEESLSLSRPFNQRVDLGYNRDDLKELDLMFDHDDMGHGLEDDELTRDKVKRASSQILQAVDRKKRKPKKPAA